MRPEIRDAVLADLLDFQAEGEDVAVREVLLASARSRLLSTVDLIPEALRGGDILQLGAAPYLLTLCLRRACAGRLVLVNYFGTDEQRGEEVLTNRRTGESLRLTYHVFNIETDDFPYPDGSFDVVMFCEIIEHLAIDPVRALSEIHRVLRPDGVVVITTPNCLSLQRFDDFLHGRSQMVDRYSPALGYGARHNREYRPYELRELLESTGFVVEEMVVRDLKEASPGKRLSRALWRRILRRYSDHPREEHIFLRARRGPRFRWSFPSSLYDQTDLYVVVREPWLEMGVNDSIQCAVGWGPLDPGRDGHGERRWTRGPAQVLLKCPPGASAVRVECFAPAADGADALAVRIIVRHRWRWPVDPTNVYADEVVRVTRGAWCTVTVPVRSPRPGDEVEVNIAPEFEAVAALPEGERGLAVRRVWFDASAGAAGRSSSTVY